MPSFPTLLIAVLAVLSLSGCVTQRLENLPVVQAVVPVAVEAKQPLQIATWSPTKYNGRYLAMTDGYLTVFNNCLALTRDNKEVTTKENAYLLVLADTSFSWDANKECKYPILNTTSLEMSFILAVVCLLILMADSQGNI